MSSHDENLHKLAREISGIKVAMLTTIAEDGTLRSRPMIAQEAAFDGALWFFTRASDPKVGEVQREPRVNVSYAAPGDHRYVSVSGKATLVRDAQKARELWTPACKGWFPPGLDDPELALLRIDPERAEYWDVPSGAMRQITGILRAVFIGQPVNPEEHEKLDLRASRT
jgi:general stress protein 26